MRRHVVSDLQFLQKCNLDVTQPNIYMSPTGYIKGLKMAWILLYAAGALEVIWAASMKASHGFTKPAWSALTGITAFASFWLLSAAMRDLPLGTAYAVWVGIGAIGAFAIGILFMGEAATPLRIGSAALIILGLIGLKLSEGA